MQTNEINPSGILLGFKNKYGADKVDNWYESPNDNTLGIICTNLSQVRSVYRAFSRVISDFKSPEQLALRHIGNDGECVVYFTFEILKSRFHSALHVYKANVFRENAEELYYIEYGEVAPSLRFKVTRNFHDS